MLDLLAKHDIIGMLVTLPAVAHRDMTEKDIEASKLVFPYFAGSYDVEKFLSLHRSYNSAIRRVAVHHHVVLVDLDESFNRHRKDEFFYVTIHLTGEGNRLLAESLAVRIEELEKASEDQALPGGNRVVCKRRFGQEYSPGGEGQRKARATVSSFKDVRAR